MQAKPLRSCKFVWSCLSRSFALRFGDSRPITSTHQSQHTFTRFFCLCLCMHACVRAPGPALTIMSPATEPTQSHQEATRSAKTQTNPLFQIKRDLLQSQHRWTDPASLHPTPSDYRTPLHNGSIHRAIPQFSNIPSVEEKPVCASLQGEQALRPGVYLCSQGSHSPKQNLKQSLNGTDRLPDGFVANDWRSTSRLCHGEAIRIHFACNDSSPKITIEHKHKTNKIKSQCTKRCLHNISTSVSKEIMAP